MGNILNMLNIKLSAGYAYENDLIKMTDESFGGRLVFGLKVAGIGIGIVFSILVSLWLILTLMGAVSQYLSKRKISSTENVVAPIETLPAPAEQADDSVTDETEDAYQDEKELVAVITAAISAYTQRPASDFRVVSFKKRGEW